MLCKYIYRNRKTGEKIYTNNIKDDENLELVQEIKNSNDLKAKIIKK